MLEHTQISERRACRLVGLSRDAWRHPPQPDAHTVRLGEWIHAVAMERRRFGYRRVHDMLRREFPGTNHKKVFRLYRAQGLAVRKRNKGKKYRGERTPLVAATRVNQTWSLDFVSDSLANGRRIKCLTIADDFTHECIDIAVDLSMPGAYVTRILDHEAPRVSRRLLGSTAKSSAKRGPMPMLARQMERISALPKARQKFLIKVLESMLAQQAG